MKLLAVLLSVALAFPLSAQTPDSLPADTTRSIKPAIFLGGVAVGVTTMFVAQYAFDHKFSDDPGGYEDGINTTVMMSDKAVHAMAGWALTSIGIDMKVNPWVAAAVITAGGALFEVHQGHISGLDILADGIGAFGAAAWRTWVK